jgi:hypothetical protein
MARKYIGKLHGVDFYEDPDCPPGKMYMLNDNYMSFSAVDIRSRWQRIKDRIKRWIS